MSDIRRFLTERSWFAVVTMLMATMVACGGGDAPESEMEMETEMAEPEAASEPMGEPRAFFVGPRDGEEISVDVPVAFEFGVENFEISPVPETVEQVRPGVGHFHLGVDAECAPAGEIIPQADPWIHFGDGSNTIEMSLEPGEHRFSVQVADDEHRTIEGLCETITVMLEEGI
jgi:hypothetical protein